MNKIQLVLLWGHGLLAVSIVQSKHGNRSQKRKLVKHVGEVHRKSNSLHVYVQLR